MTVKPWVRRWLFLPTWVPGYWRWNGWIGWIGGRLNDGTTEV